MEQLKPEDRLGGRFSRQKSVGGLLAAVVFLSGIGVVVYKTFFSNSTPAKQTTPLFIEETNSAIIRFGLSEVKFRLSAKATSILSDLSREPCDQVAIKTLGDALRAQNFRREAANAYVNYSKSCPNSVFALRSAANIFSNEISDYAAAIPIADEIIKSEPHLGNGYYIRGLAYFRANRLPEAIDDFTSSIELYSDKSKMNSNAFFKLSESYERINDFCSAMLPIYDWIRTKPDKNDTTQTKRMLTSLNEKGKCDPDRLGEDIIRRQGSVVKVQVNINGVRGTFILDTGASFLTIKSSFAEKSRVKIIEGSSVVSNTANGTVTAKRGLAENVSLVKISSRNVPILIQEDKKGLYGDDIDGLLGNSFLSRFDMKFDATSVSIATRK